MSRMSTNFKSSSIAVDISKANKTGSNNDPLPCPNRLQWCLLALGYNARHTPHGYHDTQSSSKSHPRLSERGKNAQVIDIAMRHNRSVEQKSSRRQATRQKKRQPNFLSSATHCATRVKSKRVPSFPPFSAADGRSYRRWGIQVKK